VSPQRLLPVLLLAGFSLYGLWFVPTAWSVRSASSRQAAAIHSPPDVVAPERPAAAAHPADTAASAEAVEWAQEEAAGLHVAAPLAEERAPAHVGAEMEAPSECNSTRTKPASAHVGSFNGVQWLELLPKEEELESHEMSLSAWVKWDGPEGGEVASMQTLVASKASGCDANEDHYGLALFVNEWNTNSGQLYLSWGNAQSGCEELATAPNTLPPETWAHVVAIFGGGGARLFINGVLAADTAQPALGKKRMVGALSATGNGRPLPLRRSLRVGAHADKTHPLSGVLDELEIWHEMLEPADIGRLLCGGKAAAELHARALVLLSFEAKAPPPETGLGLEPRPDAREQRVGLRVGAGMQAPSRIRLREASAAARLARHKKKLASGLSGSSFDDAPAHNVPKGEWPLEWVTAEEWLNREKPTAEQINASDALALVRREHVRNVFKRAWRSYEKYAWGMDELKPMSNRSHNWLGLGATLVDCLDNLWIFGMKEEFKRAQEWVEQHLHFDKAAGISMFETVIRILGGLLSAFELSRERVFLKKAQELADRLLYAFSKHQTGLPCTTVSLNGRGQCQFPSWAGSAAVLAEYGTMQLEFKYLAYHTGERKYWDAVEKPIKLVQKLHHPKGLYPTFINPNTGTWSSPKLTFGALADSFYEYLVKQWLLTGKTEGWLRDMWDETMLGMAGGLVQRSTPSGLAYIADWTGSAHQHKMDHLACFAPAMLAFGAQDGRKHDAQYMALAARICETCMSMYTGTRTGLAPEYVTFAKGKDMQVPRGGAFNIGRPETAESLYVMWYYTRDPKYREWGWQIFEAFEKHAFTYSGWCSKPDVDNPARKCDDKMESFVLAETMKYLFLLFDVDYPVPLEKYVLNTEAHPLGKIGLPSWVNPDPS